jgi:hypothetical protein
VGRRRKASRVTASLHALGLFWIIIRFAVLAIGIGAWPVLVGSFRHDRSAVIHSAPPSDPTLRKVGSGDESNPVGTRMSPESSLALRWWTGGIQLLGWDTREPAFRRPSASRSCQTLAVWGIQIERLSPHRTHLWKSTAWSRCGDSRIISSTRCDPHVGHPESVARFIVGHLSSWLPFPWPSRCFPAISPNPVIVAARARPRTRTQPESPPIEPVAAGALSAPESDSDEPGNEEDDGGNPQHVEGKSRPCEDQDQQQCEQNKHCGFPSMSDLMPTLFVPTGSFVQTSFAR